MELFKPYNQKHNKFFNLGGKFIVLSLKLKLFQKSEKYSTNRLWKN